MIATIGSVMVWVNFSCNQRASFYATGSATVDMTVTAVIDREYYAVTVTIASAVLPRREKSCVFQACPVLQQTSQSGGTNLPLECLSMDSWLALLAGMIISCPRTFIIE